MESKAKVRIIDEREVWWARTMQYIISIDDVEYRIRIAEDSKSCEQLIWLDDQWQYLDPERSESESVIYEMWCDGEIS
jgi:hypothetical protein